MISFQHFVLSKGDGGLRQLTQLRESYYIDVGMLLPSEVEKGLSDLFQQEISNYKQLQQAKDQLVNSLDYTSLEAFKSLDLFNQGFLSIDSLNKFMTAQSTPITSQQLEAFFTAVDTDEDGRISYAELVESVHLMEPLPYKASQAVEQILRESQLQRSLDRSRALERVYLNYYPYYVYPYSTSYYPLYYPYLALSELRLRDSSLERLRESTFLHRELIRQSSFERLRDSSLRLRAQIRDSSLDRLRESQIRLNSLERLSASRLASIQVDREMRLSRLGEERRSAERVIEQLSQDRAERLRVLEKENQERKALKASRDEDIRISLEKVRKIEDDARTRQLNADRESRFHQIERDSRFQQLQVEKRLLESDIRQSSYERLNSLERLSRLDVLGYPYTYGYPYSFGYPYTQSSYFYDPIFVPRYIPTSSIYQQEKEIISKSSYVLTPQKQSPRVGSEEVQSGIKVEEESQPQQVQQKQAVSEKDKMQQLTGGVRKSLNGQQAQQQQAQ